ncbi:hypothetical protein TNCV_1270971 [Trichonephila clavipes]|nr:hypothetical protein TNCV_1270971 [Trichonephila clavipes]
MPDRTAGRCASRHVCGGHSTRLNRDSSLKMTRLQSVTLQVARGRQKSSRHCLISGSVLADVGSSKSQSSPYGFS